MNMSAKRRMHKRTLLRIVPAVAGVAFSFAAWIRWNGGANWQRIFDFGNSTTHYMFLTPNVGSVTACEPSLGVLASSTVEVPVP